MAQVAGVTAHLITRTVNYGLVLAVVAATVSLRLVRLGVAPVTGSETRVGQVHVAIEAVGGLHWAGLECNRIAGVALSLLEVLYFVTSIVWRPRSKRREPVFMRW